MTATVFNSNWFHNWDPPAHLVPSVENFRPFPVKNFSAFQEFERSKF